MFRGIWPTPAAATGEDMIAGRDIRMNQQAWIDRPRCVPYSTFSGFLFRRLAYY